LNCRAPPCSILTLLSHLTHQQFKHNQKPLPPPCIVTNIESFLLLTRAATARPSPPSFLQAVGYPLTALPLPLTDTALIHRAFSSASQRQPIHNNHYYSLSASVRRASSQRRLDIHQVKSSQVKSSQIESRQLKSRLASPTRARREFIFRSSRPSTHRSIPLLIHSSTDRIHLETTVHSCRRPQLEFALENTS